MVWNVIVTWEAAFGPPRLVLAINSSPGYQATVTFPLKNLELRMPSRGSAKELLYGPNVIYGTKPSVQLVEIVYSDSQRDL